MQRADHAAKPNRQKERKLFMEIKTREQTVYVASDGKEFEDQDSCALYEEILAADTAYGEDLAIASRLKCFQLTPSTVNYDPDMYWTWYYVSTPEEFVSLRTEHDDWYADGAPTRREMRELYGDIIPLLPDWVAVASYEDFFSVVGTSAQVFSEMKEFLTEFKKQANAIKKG